MSPLWILVPIAIVIIAIVITFPRRLTRRRMREDDDLAAAEQFLDQIGMSDDDAAPARPAPAEQDAGRPAGWPATRGRHAASEASSAEASVPGRR